MDTIKVKGHIKVAIIDKDGNRKVYADKDNVVVTVGKTFLTEWLTQATQSDPFMSFIGLGTGSSAATAADTDLETPLATREQGTLSFAANSWVNVAEFGPGVNTGSVTEAGLFSEASSGTMFARQVFTLIPKGADDTLELTWTVTFS